MQLIKNRQENFAPRATGVLGIVLALSIAGCGKSGGSGNQDSSVADTPPTPAYTVVFSDVPATIGPGENILVTATVTKNLAGPNLVCISWSSPLSITPNADATTCTGAKEIGVPCVYAFNLNGDDVKIYSFESKYELYGSIDCSTDKISEYAYKTVDVTLIVPPPDAAVPADVAPPVGKLSVAWSLPPATLYVGQTAAVTATVTATVPLSDIVCSLPNGSHTLSGGVSVNCNGTVAANTPCEYDFTFTGHDSDIEKGELETVIANMIVCRSDTLNVSVVKNFSVTLMLDQGRAGDAGVSYCSIMTADLVDAGNPCVQITGVPPRGATGNVEGKVSGVVPYCNRIVVYIYVDNGWWIKPYYNVPLTTINDNGTWSANIVTGGDDRNATSIVAYLVPSDYNPLMLTGSANLPESLDAFPSAVVNR